MTTRMSVLGDSFGGDQERDANSLLLELDKGMFTISLYIFENMNSKFQFKVIVT